MKRILLIVAALAGLFVIVQWFLSRRNTLLAENDEARKAADRAGQAQEALGLVNRPRLSDDARAGLVDGIFETVGGLWGQIRGDTSQVKSGNGALLARPWDAFLYGYRN